MTARARLAGPSDPGVAEPWRALAAAAVEPNPFFEPDAVLPAARLRPDGTGVRLLVVEDGDDLLLALPVVRRRYRRTVRALLAWHHPYCYAGAALLAPGQGERAWDAALDALDAGPDHLLVLPRTPVAGPGAAAVQSALHRRQRRATTTDAWDRPVVHRRPVDDYLDGRLGARSRKALRRHRRRLGEALGGDVVVQDAARDPSGLADALDQLLALEASGWKGRAGTAIASSPADVALFRAWCDRFDAGRVQLWTLGVPGRPAAAQLNLIAGDTVFHVKTAYEPAHASCSPGLQLEVAMVEQFHLDGRLQHLDSCTDPGPTPSERLYPDRQPLATLLVPLGGRAGRLAAATLPAALGAADGARAALARRRAGRGSPA